MSLACTCFWRNLSNPNCHTRSCNKRMYKPIMFLYISALLKTDLHQWEVLF